MLSVTGESENPADSLRLRAFLATMVTFIVTVFLLSAVSLDSGSKEHPGIYYI